MEMLINILSVLLWFFFCSFNALTYLFAIYAFIERKTIVFGISGMKPTWLIFLMVYTVPFLLTFLLFVLYYEYNFVTIS